MALSDATLGGLIKAEISAVLEITDDDKLTSVCNAIAKAVVTHIQAAATVPAGIAVQVNTGTGTGATTGVGTVQ